MRPPHPPPALIPVLAVLLVAASAGDAQAPSFVPVATAQELEACMESPATPWCLLTQTILFSGNETERFLDLALPADTLSHLRCAPGAYIIWDNWDGPGVDVDVVRMVLKAREEVVVENCWVETRVNGRADLGHPTGVQLLFARHPTRDPATTSNVTVLGGGFRTAYHGSSTIALGCNCNGATSWTIDGALVMGPIALDAKGGTTDGSPLDWRVTNSILVALEPASSNPRCWKQKDDVRFVDLTGTTCWGGLMQFAAPTGVNGGHRHDLSGLVVTNSPPPGVGSGALIVTENPHGFVGTFRVHDDPGNGNPLDKRSHNLITAYDGLGVVDLRVEFEDCHRAFSPDITKDSALDLRAGLVEHHQLLVAGPEDCGNPTKLFNGVTIDTLAASSTSGYAATTSGESFDLQDGIPMPEPSGDNCLGAFNPDQRDSDADGYGDLCDADYDNDGMVGLPDFTVFAHAFGAVAGQPEFAAAVDHDGNGAIGLADFSVFGEAFGTPPGPSASACAGSPPCP